MGDRWSLGDRLGDRFRLERKIGVGSFSVVWRALDEVDQSPVAVKLLHPELPALQRAGERLAREAELLLTLDHPNIAGARAFLATELALVLEYVEGQTLREIMVERAKAGLGFSLAEVARLGTELLSALEAAHTAGVVHRDLKPANLIISPTGHLKVLDFGIAKLVQAAGDATTIGRVLGTWLYMSPEQARGETIDHRADLFAVGVLLFELLTLRRPFVNDASGRPLGIQIDPREVPGNSRYEILQRLVLGTRPDLEDHRAEAPEALATLLRKALDPEPTVRPSSAAAMALALVEALPELTMTRSGAPAWSEAVTRLGAADAPMPAPTRIVGMTSNRTAEPLLQRHSSTLDGSTEDGPPISTQTKWVGGPTTMLPRPRARPGPRGLLIAALVGVALAAALISSRSVVRKAEEVPIAVVIPPAPPPVSAQANPSVGATERPVTPPEPPPPPDLPPPEPPSRRPTARPEPPKLHSSKGVEPDRLGSLFEAAARDPDNPEQMTRLARALKEALKDLPEPDRSRIARCVTSSELGGKVADLGRCYERLRQARRQP